MHAITPFQSVRIRPSDLNDNLSACLVLLERRLVERDAPLRIQRIGRGRIRLVTQRPLVRETREVL
jgi:adenylate cyclase